MYLTDIGIGVGIGNMAQLLYYDCWVMLQTTWQRSWRLRFWVTLTGVSISSRACRPTGPSATSLPTRYDPRVGWGWARDFAHNLFILSILPSVSLLSFLFFPFLFSPPPFAVFRCLLSSSFALLNPARVWWSAVSCLAGSGYRTSAAEAIVENMEPGRGVWWQRFGFLMCR